MAGKPKHAVMLSSTYGEFADHRRAVEQAMLGQELFPVAQENDAALADHDLISASLAKVDEADAYVGLISYRYGQAPEDADRNPNRLSLTELEFRRALDRKIPICMFIMHDDHAVPRSVVTAESDLERTKLEAFIELAKKDRIYAEFKSLDDLKAKAVQSLVKLREAMEKRERRRWEEEAAERSRLEEEEQRKRKKEEDRLRDDVARMDFEMLNPPGQTSFHEPVTAVRVPLPPIEIIPEQSRRAIIFTSVRFGALALVPDASGTEVDPEQEELYSRMRGQLRILLAQVPGQERGQVTRAVEDFLKHPENWRDVRFKKTLWLSGNTLRNILAQHDVVNRDPEPHYAKLPPAVAEILRPSVETWNVVILGDETLRQLDSQRLGPREVQATRSELATAEPILIAAAEDRSVTTNEAADAIQASLAAARAPADNIHTRQAQELARGTTQNLIVQILRGAHRTAQDLQDPQTEEARAFVKEYKAGMAKKLGEWTISGVAIGIGSVGLSAYYFGTPFFEFVVAQGPIFKAYLGDVFQNPQLMQIVTSLETLRERLLGKLGSQ